MSSEAAIKRLKIKSFFSYHEEKISDSEVIFGWKASSSEDIELPFIVSYGSKAKSVSKEDAEWSKDAGINAASLSDYLKYFKSLTGDTPDDFLNKWSDNLSALEEIRKSANPTYREGEGEFLISLSNLLVNGTRFTQYGRIFKLIDE